MVYREKKSPGVTRLTGGALQAYPVGAVYQSLDPTDPAQLFGGTWVRIKGRVLVGVDEADPDFASASLAGGEKKHVLTAAELPNHTHGAGTLAATSTGSGHTHNVNRRNQAGTTGGVAMGAGALNTDDNTGTTGSGHTHTVTGDTGTGNGLTSTPHENMPPYYTIYMWRRSA